MRKNILSVEEAQTDLLRLGYAMRTRRGDGHSYVEGTIRKKAVPATKTTPKVKAENLSISSRPSPDERAENPQLYDWLDQNAVADGSKLVVFN